jgi:predicted ATPase
MPRSVPFVGREVELALLAERFEHGARLLTLHGPGGIGKTSLAVEHAARRVASGDRSSVVFCDASSARDGAGVLDAMALACGDAGGGGAGEDPVAQLGAALAARGDVLVVLDNLDGLADAAGELVTAWLRAAPETEWVVTSRETLGVLGEHVVELGPLDESVALLVASARRGSSAFGLRPEDAAAASELVTLLEGVPLAIELAGPRLPLLGVRGLLERVRASRGAMSLRRDVKGGPARHESLDAAVRGSFEALEAPERDVLAQLTVFRGGFTSATAAAVVRVEASGGGARVEASGGGARENDEAVFDAIGRLRARSLVRTCDAGGARFDLYAAVRSFVEREHAATIAAATERHEAYFVASAERAAEIAHGDAGARSWLAAERENVLALAARVLGAGPVTALAAEPALRGIVALSPLLLARGLLASVARLVAPVVERTRESGADPRLTARATLLRGAILRERGDTRGALRDLLGAESIGRALGDELLSADARVELGRTLLAAGESAAARDHFDKASRAFAALGARAREAHALGWSAVSRAAEPAAARASAERAVALAAADPASRAPYLVVLGRACAELGDVGASKRALTEAAAVAAADGDARSFGVARLLLGLVLHEAGDPARAEELLADARDRFELLGLDTDAAIARGHLGMLALEAGRAAEAYALLADARDASLRGGRPGERAHFEAQLGAGAATAPAGAEGAREAAPGPRDLVSAWPVGGAAGLLGRLAARVAASRGGGAARAEPLPADALVVGDRGSWFRAPDQARVGLERRPSLALLLDRLASERLGAAKTLASSSLFTAAWPGEKALASAAAHRVRVAVATLRKMGLRDAIVTLPDGYALSPDVRVVRA